MHITREEALSLLGLKDDATPENVRRAFKIQALKHHPDKNTSQAEAATQAFQRLVAAYQRLISPTADQSWEDLDLGDVLTEEFFEEALRLHEEIPAFELMFIHESMCRGKAGLNGPGVSVWGDAGTCADKRAKEALWRQIHESLRKRRRKAEAAHAPGPDRGLQRSRPFQNTKEGRLQLFWDFLSDLVRHSEHDFCLVDEETGEVVAESVPLPGRSVDGWSSCPQTQQLLEHSHAGTPLLLPAAQSAQQTSAAAAAPVASVPARRMRPQARLRSTASPARQQADEQHQQHQQEGSGWEAQAPTSQASCASCADEGNSSTQVVQGPGHMGTLKPAGGDAQPEAQAAAPPAQRVRHNWRFYWTWAKRLLVLKAFSMLLRT